MATTRLKEKAAKRSLRDRQKSAGPQVSQRGTRRSSNRLPASTNDNGDVETSDSEAEEQTSYMSLDVLAQVASATLEKEPKFNEKSLTPKKLTKRSIQSLEVLNLDQIQALSDKALLSLFSDMTSNEMTRNYTYTCYLMPDKCKEKFTSFGNETRARMKMRTHLLSHIEQLIDDANDPDLTEKFVFSAVPVTVRKKKLAEAAKKRKTPTQNTTSSSPGKAKKSASPIAKFTALKPSRKTVSDPKCKPSNSPASKAKSHSKTDNFNRNSEEEEVKENSLKRKKTNRAISPNKKDMARRYAHKKSTLQTVGADSGNQKDTKSGATKVKKEKLKGKHGSSGEKGEGSENESDDNLHEETERRIEENEQFIIDLLSRTQPHHDHCYTTIFGKKRGIETMHFDLESSGEEENGVIDVCDNGSEDSEKRKSTKPIMLLQLPAVAELPMVSMEEVVNESEGSNSDEDDEDGEGHNGEKPYPPMPKSNLAKKGRLIVPEENALYSDHEDDIISPRKRRKIAAVEKGEQAEITPEWERRMALKCIRELKNRRKDDKVPLICKICKDKTFTASATLMYHYRSHAGIKPFVCLICNTTFTRQHSLNYHMLIHNNQSRFTCKDCGRKFRHPSHFKEHLRRHTGETPFECMDCPLKFKTRNTYKRHLKTRHGKLLTATGIRMLSKEEFLKVRTKPYKKLSGDDDQDDSNSKQEGSESGSLSPCEDSTDFPDVGDETSLYVPLGIVVNS
ncbi:uncharacterized protein [Haliotis cracherodii]|uniref:uncharacterized protein n=1 Tax=Haliotis cracherodii TaxID=6455 RepID=UPI0039EAF921